jgi:hypothetical protein
MFPEMAWVPWPHHYSAALDQQQTHCKLSILYPDTHPEWWLGDLLAGWPNDQAPMLTWISLSHWDRQLSSVFRRQGKTLLPIKHRQRETGTVVLLLWLSPSSVIKTEETTDEAAVWIHPKTTLPHCKALHNYFHPSPLKKWHLGFVGVLRRQVPGSQPSLPSRWPQFLLSKEQWHLLFFPFLSFPFMLTFVVYRIPADKWFQQNFHILQKPQKH